MLFAVALNLAGLLAALPTTASEDASISPAAEVAEISPTTAEQWESRYEQRLAKVLGEDWRVTIVYEPTTETATVMLNELNTSNSKTLSHTAVEEIVAAILPASKQNRSHRIVFADSSTVATPATASGSGWLQTLAHIAMVSLSLALMTLTFVVTQAIWSLRKERNIAGNQISESPQHDLEVAVQPARTAA